MPMKHLVMTIMVYLLLLTVAEAVPPVPARIGGTVTINGKQLVRTGDKGIDADGHKKANHEPSAKAAWIDFEGGPGIALPVSGLGQSHSNSTWRECSTGLCARQLPITETGLN